MNITSSTSHSLIEGFLSGCSFSSYAFRRLVIAAEQRSEDYGLSPRAKCSLEVVASPSQLKEANHALLSAAEPVMRYVASQLKAQRNDALLILANAKATIIAVAGDNSTYTPPELRDIRPGIDWSEDARGTNALGSALVAKQPMLINEGEHYLARLKDFSCASVLIKDCHNKVLGALCITRPGPLPQVRDGMTLLTVAVHHIARRYFIATHEQHYIVTLHKEKAFLDTPGQGLLAVDDRGVVCAADEKALKHLEARQSKIVDVSWETLFGVPWTGFCQRTKHAGSLQHNNKKLAYDILRWPAYTTRFTSRPKPEKNLPHSELVQQSKRYRSEIKRLQRGFESFLPVLLLGEPGAGKKTLAQDLHNQTLSKKAPFVCLNCSTVSDVVLENQLVGDGTSLQQGALREAMGGTLFLDAAQALSPRLQRLFMRILQSQRHAEPANAVRMIVAASVAPKQLLESAQWLADFYYEVSGLAMELPPLRERTDILRICEDFMRRETSDKFVLSASLQTLLARYHWPGNIRQLRMVLRTLITTADTEKGEIDLNDLPRDLLSELQQPQAEAQVGLDLRSNELVLIQEAINRNDGNMSAAARDLGVSRATLYRKIKQLAS